jgi:hypothetical protein
MKKLNLLHVIILYSFIGCGAKSGTDYYKIETATVYKSQIDLLEDLINPSLALDDGTLNLNSEDELNHLLSGEFKDIEKASETFLLESSKYCNNQDSLTIISLKILSQLSDEAQKVTFSKRLLERYENCLSQNSLKVITAFMSSDIISMTKGFESSVQEFIKRNKEIVNIYTIKLAAVYLNNKNRANLLDLISIKEMFKDNRFENVLDSKLIKSLIENRYKVGRVGHVNLEDMRPLKITESKWNINYFHQFEGDAPEYHSTSILSGTLSPIAYEKGFKGKKSRSGIASFNFGSLISNIDDKKISINMSYSVNVKGGHNVDGRDRDRWGYASATISKTIKIPQCLSQLSGCHYISKLKANVISNAAVILKTPAGELKRVVTNEEFFLDSRLGDYELQINSSTGNLQMAGACCTADASGTVQIDISDIDPFIDFNKILDIEMEEKNLYSLGALNSLMKKSIDRKLPNMVLDLLLYDAIEKLDLNEADVFTARNDLNFLFYKHFFQSVSLLDLENELVVGDLVETMKKVQGLVLDEKMTDAQFFNRVDELRSEINKKISIFGDAEIQEILRVINSSAKARFAKRGMLVEVYELIHKAMENLETRRLIRKYLKNINQSVSEL